MVSSEEYKVITERYPLDWIAIKTLEEDFNFLAFIKTKYKIDLLAMSEGERKEIRQRYDLDPSDAIARARYGTIRGIVSTNFKKGTTNKFEITDKIDKILLNKFHLL